MRYKQNVCVVFLVSRVHGEFSHSLSLQATRDGRSCFPTASGFTSFGPIHPASRNAGLRRTGAPEL
jgi:hypothetical protein